MFRKLIGTLGALALVVSLNSAYSDDSASLYLAGEVGLISNLFVTPTAAATDLLDIVGGEALRPIAQVEEISNNAAGYTISLESTNAGELQNPAVGSTPVAYQIRYGATGTLTTPAALGSGGTVVKTSGVLTALTTTTEDVAITFTGSGTALAGAYTDTVVFIMTAL